MITCLPQVSVWGFNPVCSIKKSKTSIYQHFHFMKQFINLSWSAWILSLMRIHRGLGTQRKSISVWAERRLTMIDFCTEVTGRPDPVQMITAAVSFQWYVSPWNMHMFVSLWIICRQARHANDSVPYAGAGFRDTVSHLSKHKDNEAVFFLYQEMCTAIAVTFPHWITCPWVQSGQATKEEMCRRFCKLGLSGDRSEVLLSERW